ncbi:MAG: Ankyrin [Haloplasmataceae bacterium]|jgi:ankyrin repeat protein|nr:Ankyrin [Haloplasmataceae bacterium]
MRKNLDKIVIVFLSVVLLASSAYVTYYLLYRNDPSEVVEQYSNDEKEDIYNLIMNGNLDGYGKYLDDGKKLSFAFNDKTTPLELLIEQNDILSAVELMENGFDLTLVNNNHIDTVTAILARNELIGFESIDQIAIQLVEQIKDEIENEDTYGYSLLINAVETNNYHLVEEILKYISDINRIYNGESAFSFACLSGEADLEMIKLLVDKGADVNLQKDDGNTCLINILRYEQPEVIYYLLTETNINVNLKNDDGQTALHIAVLYTNFMGIEYLVELSNIDKNITDKDGKTAKDYAIELKDEFPEYLVYINRL